MKSFVLSSLLVLGAVAIDSSAPTIQLNLGESYAPSHKVVKGGVTKLAAAHVSRNRALHKYKHGPDVGKGKGKNQLGKDRWDRHPGVSYIGHSVVCHAGLASTKKHKDNAISCPEPTYKAWDHHDEDITSKVSTTITCVDTNRPYPNHNKGCPKVPLFKTWTKKNFANRGQWIFKYEVVDRSGNIAVPVTFSIILDDEVKPELTYPSGYTVQSCDKDGYSMDGGDRKIHIFKTFSQLKAIDNVDGDITHHIKVSMTTPRVPHLWGDNSAWLTCKHAKTGKAGWLEPVQKARCPLRGNLPNCNNVGCGQLCEGDGECGTNQNLNQCNPGSWDIYKRHCVPQNKKTCVLPWSNKHQCNHPHIETYAFVLGKSRHAQFIDTRRLGNHVWHYTVCDFAGRYGKNQHNNCNAGSTTIKVIDTIKPNVVCKKSYCHNYPKMIPFGGRPLRKTYSFRTRDQCCAQCNAQAASRLIGSKNHPGACTHYHYHKNGACILYGGKARLMSSKGHANTGFPIACNYINHWECGNKYTDYGAWCVDISASYHSKTSINVNGLQIHTSVRFSGKTSSRACRTILKSTPVKPCLKNTLQCRNTYTNCKLCNGPACKPMCIAGSGTWMGPRILKNHPWRPKFYGDCCHKKIAIKTQFGKKFTCYNGGKCGAHTCQCPTGFTGPNCLLNDVNAWQKGTYKITYRCSDYVGLKGSQTRTVTVRDTTPPTLTLTTGDSHTLKRYTKEFRGHEDRTIYKGAVYRSKLAGHAAGKGSSCYLFTPAAAAAAAAAGNPCVARMPSHEWITLNGAKYFGTKKDQLYKGIKLTKDNVVTQGGRDHSGNGWRHNGIDTAKFNVNDKKWAVGSDGRNWLDSHVIQVSAGYIKDIAIIRNLQKTGFGMKCEDACSSYPTRTYTAWGKKKWSDTQPGTYILKYVCVDHSSNTHTKYRTIISEDKTKPVLTVLGHDITTIEASPTQEYVDDGATCCDVTDGMISNKVEVSGDIVNQKSFARHKCYTISYNCRDRHGHKADTAYRKVCVVRRACPTCKITGGGLVSREASFPYTDQGALCADHMDGKTHTYVNNGVNVEAESTYYVTYRSKNTANLWNDYQKCLYGPKKYTRTVIVKDTLQPVIALHYKNKVVKIGTTDQYQAKTARNHMWVGKLDFPYFSAFSKPSLFGIGNPANKHWKLGNNIKNVIAPKLFTDIHGHTQNKYAPLSHSPGHRWAGMGNTYKDNGKGMGIHRGHQHVHLMAESAQSSSVNGWVLGAIASAVTGLALLGYSARKTAVSSVPV